MYACPRGCQRNGKPIPINTLRGWKKHMTGTHQGFTDEELQAIVSAQPEATAVTGEESFEAFGAKLGDTPEGIAPDPAATKPADTATISAEQQKLTKKVNAHMKKLKELVSKRVPALAGKQFLGEDSALDPLEQDVMDESFALMFEGMGVTFDIVPWNVVLKSPWWLFLYPLCALGIIFGLKLVGKKGIFPVAEQDNRVDSAEGKRENVQGS